MQKRLAFITGAAVGYVLGARAGKERYAQISALAGKAMGTPQAQKAKGVAREQAGHLADQAKDKAAGIAVDAKDKAAGLAVDAKNTVVDKVAPVVADGKAKIADKVHGTDGLVEPSEPVTGEAGEQATAPVKGSGYSI